MDALAFAVETARRAKERREQEAAEAAEAAEEERQAAEEAAEAAELAAREGATRPAESHSPVGREPGRLAWMNAQEEELRRISAAEIHRQEKIRREADFLAKKEVKARLRAAKNLIRREDIRKRHAEVCRQWEANRERRKAEHNAYLVDKAARDNAAIKAARTARMLRAEKKKKEAAMSVMNELAKRSGLGDPRYVHAPTREASGKRCCEIAGAYFGVTADQIVGPGRERNVGLARTVAGLLMILQHMSYEQISVVLNRDRSTVYHYRNAKSPEVWTAMEALVHPMHPAERVVQSAPLDGDEWIELAVLALDQAGVSASTQARVRAMVSK